MRATIPQLAAKYAVHPRTVLRWKKRGVQVDDALAVADHIIEHPGQGLHTLRAVTAAVAALPPVDGGKVYAEAFKKALS